MPEKIEYFQISAATYAIATIFCVLRRGVTTSVSVLGTDLALEAAQMQEKTVRLTSRPGLEVRRRERGGYALTAMDLTDPHRAAELQRPVGKYITMELGPYLHRQRDFFARGAGCIARELAALLPEGEDPTLVVGLGNRSLTADAVGPLALPHILVTRHMLAAMPEEFAGFSSVAALATGVLGETGLESSELIAAAAEKLRPRCIIVLDALAAATREKLCAVLQLTNTGLTPGSGVGNHRKEVSRRTLGGAGAGPGPAHGDPGRAAGRGGDPGGGGAPVRHPSGHRPAGPGAEPHDGLRHRPGPPAPPDGGGHHGFAGVRGEEGFGKDSPGRSVAPIEPLTPPNFLL